MEHDYKSLVREAGLPFIPFKNLRHSHISHLERVGASVAVAQQRAGHSSPTITLGTYTKVDPDEQREPVRRIARELFDDPDPATTRGHARTRAARAWIGMGSA